MKKEITGLLIGLSVLGLAGCQPDQNTDKIVADKQETLLAEAQRQTGIPNIINFQEKKLLKLIYELRDRADLVNYAYLYSDMTGKLIYLGECVGYGIPYATQYSNPERRINTDFASSAQYNMPQAEPNGLFMPSSANGTWIMLVDPATKKPKPVYAEPNVIISPFKLQ